MRILYIIIIFLLVFISYSVHASIVIISPKMSTFFKPSVTEQYSFAVTNRLDQEIYLEIYPSGDIKDYILINTPNFTIGPRQTASIDYSINYPAYLKPGMHLNYIVVRELSRGGGGTISTVPESAFMIDLKVPYPGDYLEANIDTDNSVQAGEDVSVSLKLDNLGTNDLFGVESIVEFFDKGKKVGFLRFDKVDIKNKDSITLRNYYSTKDWNLGVYLANATINYANEEIHLSKYFNVGDIKIEIIGLNKTRFEKNKISRVEVVAASKWNEPITNVYAILSFLNKNGKNIEVRSASTDISPWDKMSIPVFLDTSELDKGIHKLNVTLFYLNKTEFKSFDIEVYESLFGYILRTETILIIIIIILCTLFVINYLKSRRFKKKSDKK